MRHEAWKRSDLNQRQYCEAECIPLEAFGNWRAVFKAEPQPPERKLLYRRRGLSPPISPQLSPPFSPPLNPGTYPPPARQAPSLRDRVRDIGAGSVRRTSTSAIARVKAGLDLAIKRGWLLLHESGTFVKFTPTGAEPFA